MNIRLFLHHQDNIALARPRFTDKKIRSSASLHPHTQEGNRQVVRGEDTNWKLAVKLLELIPRCGLSPVMSVWWKELLTCCKYEKSCKATTVLLDRVSRSFGMHFGGRMENDLPCRASIVLLTNPLFIFRSLWRRRGKPKSLQYPYSTWW
jgi:hypothetical protein